MGLPRPCTGETEREFLVRGAESQDTYDLLGDDAGLRQACARGQWLARYDPIVPRVIPREVAFKAPVPERAIPFACIASTGNPCRIEPYTYKVIHDFSSLQLPEEPIPVRFRHFDGWNSVIGRVTYMRIRGRDLYAAGWLVDSGENAVTWIKERVAAGDLLGVSLGTATHAFEYAPNVACANGRIHDGPLLVARKTPIEELSVCPEGLAADKDTYLLMVGMPWLNFARYCDCRLSVAELLKLRRRFDEGNAKLAEVKALAKKKAEEIRAQTREWERQDLLAERAAQLRERQETKANQRDYIRAFDSGRLEVLAAASLERCKPGFCGR